MPVDAAMSLVRKSRVGLTTAIVLTVVCKSSWLVIDSKQTVLNEEKDDSKQMWMSTRAERLTKLQQPLNFACKGYASHRG
jgi:uncharacterized membrane protein